MKTRQGVMALVLAATWPGVGLGAQIVATQSYETPIKDDGLGNPAGLDVRKVSLVSALDALTSTSRVVISFSPSLVARYSRQVSCNCKHVTVGEALDTLLLGSPFDYLSARGQVFIVPKSQTEAPRIGNEPHPLYAALLPNTNKPLDLSFLTNATMPQDTAVSGIVVDARTQRPLSQAQVSAVGTPFRTQTNSEGRFRLSGLEGTEIRLEVRMIGYRPLTQQVPIGTDNLRIGLEEAVIKLDEVVVTGTAGEAQKRSLGNAVSKVDAANIVETAPVSDVGQLLNGRAAGVVVRQPNGVAGGGTQINIRGRHSLSLAGNPLIYVDGVRIDNTFPAPGGPGDQQVTSRLDDINLDDIQSIEIIKGPAAATLYGTEAANGVVQILTKQGTQGPMVADLRIRQGGAFLQDAGSRFPVTYARDPVSGEIRSLNIVEREAQAGRPIFSRGHQQGYGLSLRGGLSQVNYYLGLDYDRSEGAETNNYVNRFGARANVTAFPTPNLDVQTSMGLTLNRTSLSGVESQTGGPGSTGGEILYSDPLGIDTPKRGFRFAPPEVDRAAAERMQPVNHFVGSLQVRHRPWGWFRQRLTAGVDLINQTTEYTVPYMIPQYAQFFSQFWASGVKDYYVHYTRNITFDYGATATAPLGALAANTSGGMQLYYKRTEFSHERGTGFPGPNITALSGASAILEASEGYVENTTVGVYVQEQLAWRDRLFLTAALRGDDNSAFGTNFDFVTYPKISGSWVVNEEPFWHVSFVNGLRLRAAYGVAGQQPDAFAATRTYRAIPGANDQPGITPGNFGNPDLKPERAKELELGFEASLLADRIGIDFTYYNQRTSDAILLRDLPPSLGFGTNRQFFNAGVVRNRGIELLLTGRPVESKSFGLDFSLNLSTNANRVESIGLPGVTFIETGWIPNRHQIGYPAASYFGKKAVSADRDALGNLTNVMCDAGGGAAPVPCSDAPFLYLAKPNPDFEGSFGTNISIGGRLRLGAMIDFRHGFSTYSWSDYSRCGTYGLCRENVAPQEFTPLHMAELALATNFEGGMFIKDRSYAKLREVSLAYTLPDRWARSMGASRALITLAGRNLHTWTKYRGLDPENVITRPGVFDQNSPWDGEQLPALTQFVTTISLTF